VIAAIGIAPFLDGSLHRVHLYQLNKAAKMGDEIDRKLHLFINRDSREKTADLPPFDFVAVRDMLDAAARDASPTADPTAQHARTAEIIGAFGELYNLGMATIPEVERMRAYLTAKLPRRRHESLAGPVEEMPPHSDVARFRRLWTIANDPLTILDDLNEYAVSRDMAQAVFDLYPLVFQRIDEGVTSQLFRKKAQAPGYRLSIRKEQLLRVLIQKEDVTSKALGVALQAQFAAMAAEAAPKPPQPQKKGSGGADTESSASDRIAAG
jgi:hypothetical protein